MGKVNTYASFCTSKNEKLRLERIFCFGEHILKNWNLMSLDFILFWGAVWYVVVVLHKFGKPFPMIFLMLNMFSQLFKQIKVLYVFLYIFQTQHLFPNISKNKSEQSQTNPKTWTNSKTNPTHLPTKSKQSQQSVDKCQHIGFGILLWFLCSWFNKGF